MFDNQTKAELHQQIVGDCQDCHKCLLFKERKSVVVSRTRLDGMTNLNASLMVIGEAPGSQEDESGLPFVGPAGHILQTALRELKIEDQTYITNTVKCRPPANRKPTAEELQDCADYLDSQIAIVQPKLIVGLGAIAAQRLIGNYNEPAIVSKCINRTWFYHKIKVRILHHPAYMLYLKEKDADAYKQFKQEYWHQWLAVSNLLIDSIKQHNIGVMNEQREQANL